LPDDPSLVRWQQPPQTPEFLVRSIGPLGAHDGRRRPHRRPYGIDRSADRLTILCGGIAQAGHSSGPGPEILRLGEPEFVRIFTRGLSLGPLTVHDAHALFGAVGIVVRLRATAKAQSASFLDLSPAVAQEPRSTIHTT